MNGYANSKNDEELIKMLEEMQDELDSKDRTIENLEKQLQTSVPSSEVSSLKNKIQKQSEMIVSLNGQIEMMSESDNAYKQNRLLEKKLNDQELRLKQKSENLQRKEAELEVRAGNVSAKEYKTEQMYSYVQDLQDNREAYINEMASNMISDEKAALQASYEQKNKALINSIKSEKQKLEKQYQKLSTDLHTKYKKLSLTNEGIMINICICMAILCIISSNFAHKF